MSLLHLTPSPLCLGLQGELGFPGYDGLPGVVGYPGNEGHQGSPGEKVGACRESIVYGVPQSSGGFNWVLSSFSAQNLSSDDVLSTRVPEDQLEVLD